MYSVFVVITTCEVLVFFIFNTATIQHFYEHFYVHLDPDSIFLETLYRLLQILIKAWLLEQRKGRRESV